MRLELTHRNRHYPLKVACLPISPSAQINMREKMYCAQNRTRTCTALRPLVPETSVSTNFTIWANGNSVVERKKAKLFRFAFCFKFQERKTGLEPATPTLARSCSTNWAIFAIIFFVFKMKSLFHLFFQLRCKDSLFLRIYKYFGPKNVGFLYFFHKTTQYTTDFL